MADKKVDGKESVRLATNTNTIPNLKEAPLIIDSVSINEGDRILVKNKASIDGVEPVSEVRNGIYIVRKISGGSASLIRSKDANINKEVTAGMYVIVTEGASNQNTGWFLITNDPIIVDTTPLLFEKFTNAGSISDSIQQSINANSDNIALLAFRNQTQDSLTLQKMVEGIVDEYEDENNIDNVASIDEVYDADNDLYSTEDDKTKLLLHNDGADGSTIIIDSSPSAYNITPVGNAQLDTSQKEFGTASLLLDGNGDYLSVPDDPDWDFGTGDVTIDLRFRLPNLLPSGVRMVFIGRHNGSLGQDDGSWFLEIFNNSGTIEFRFFIHDSGFQSFTRTANTVLADTWYHLAFTRSSGTARIFQDGSLLGSSGSYAFDATKSANHALIVGGVLDTGLLILPFDGWLDEVRFSKDIARFTANFTPATSEYNTVVDSTIISEAFTAVTQADDARMVMFIEELETLVLGTDLKAFASRDDGTTYSEITLVNRGEYQNGKNVLAGSVDISSQPAGTSMRYKIETFNKKFNIHGSALSWK